MNCPTLPLLITLGIALIGGLTPISAEMMDPPEGLAQIESDFTVEVTADRLEELLQEKGLTLFNRIDHAANAALVEQTLRPTELLIFGNPQAGTALMQCDQTVGLDLPLKVLIWQDTAGQVWLGYNRPGHLMERYDLQDCGGVLDTIDAALEGLATAATTAPQPE
jgi:uncharacterized protein (DUF302 family)